MTHGFMSHGLCSVVITVLILFSTKNACLGITLTSLCGRLVILPQGQTYRALMESALSVMGPQASHASSLSLFSFGTVMEATAPAAAAEPLSSTPTSPRSQEIIARLQQQLSNQSVG